MRWLVVTALMAAACGGSVDAVEFGGSGGEGGAGCDAGVSDLPSIDVDGSAPACPCGWIHCGDSCVETPDECV